MKKNDFPDGFRKKWSMRKKIIMRMKLFAVLICFVGLTGSFASTAQTKLKLNIKNTTIKNVLNQIENQSEYSFMYDASKINVDRKINLIVEKSSVEDILKIIFSNQNVSYRIIDRHIIISKKSDSESGNILFSQQNKKISGKVTDSSGAPLPGVAMIIKGTTTGTVTDVNGNYSLSRIPYNATLVFSFIGMKTQEIVAKDKSMINVIMQNEAVGLDEVVAIGYGTAKRSDITGAISSVPMNLAENQHMSLSSLLAGRIAGLTVSNKSGDFTSGTKMRIRGPNSLSKSNDPLTVVDGVIGKSMGSIYDVKSIEVLKDASATAIYGEAASNGVILITTKRASSEEPEIKVSLDTSFGITNGDYDDAMSPGEYAEYINNFYGDGTFSDSEIADFNNNGGTNWPDKVMQNTTTQAHHISYSQKKGTLGVFISGDYSSGDGVMVNSKYGGNYSFMSKIDFEPAKNLTMHLDVSGDRSDRKNGGSSTGSGDKSDPLIQALIWSPTESVWDDEESGLYNKSDSYGSLWFNPYMNAMEMNYWKLDHNVKTALDINYKISNCLTYTIQGIAVKSSEETGEVINKWITDGETSAKRTGKENSSWRLINKINFNKTFNDVHNIAATAVYEAAHSKEWSVWSKGSDLPMPEVSSYYNTAMANEREGGSGYGKNRSLAFLARINYNYKSRYYLTSSYRLDAKSGPTGRKEENKWGGFPSIAASWRISEEPFMENAGVDNLKVRLGWGKTGNPCGWPLTKMDDENYDYGTGTKSLGYLLGTPANSNLKWEETTQKNIGIDLTILDEKLSLTVDYFKKETTDLLTSTKIASFMGYGRTASYTQNLGEIDNTGYEITIDYTPIQTKDFFWALNFNVSHYKNEVIDLGAQDAYLTGTTGNGATDSYMYMISEGLAMGTMWGYKCLGIWKSEEAVEAATYGAQPGDYKYEDLNNDGTISLADDGQIIGDSNPDISWGISSIISYKNFNLSIAIQGMHGQDIFNFGRGMMASRCADSRTVMLNGPAFDYWTPTNNNSQWPDYHSSTNIVHFNSTKWIEDGSWVKLRNVALTYNFPRRMINFGDLSFTLSGQNLLTLTSYKGFDPEVSASGNSDTWGGCDFGTLPIPKVVTLGIDLRF